MFGRMRERREEEKVCTSERMREKLAPIFVLIEGKLKSLD